MEDWESNLQAKFDSSEQLKQLKDENTRLRGKLKRVADVFAEHGIIHNTPHAKQQWIDGN